MSAPTSFPTSATHYLQLHPLYYDIKQLEGAVKTALKSSPKRPKWTPPTPGSPQDSPDNAAPPDLFHVHSCTVEASLEPPEAELEYHSRPHEANPAYTLFSSMRDSIRKAADPFVPVTLVSPSPDLLHIPLKDGRHAAKSTVQRPFATAGVHLPGAKRRLVLLHRFLRKTGDEWIANTSAWDLENWIHAALSLDPKQPTVRMQAHKDPKRRVQLRTHLQVCWVPAGEGEDADVEIKLLVTINAYLDLTTLFEPLPDAGQELLGFLLHCLIPSPTQAVYNSDAAARAAALRHFFAALPPAPEPLSLSYAALQPKEMISTLLPFQRRSVGLLLQREGAPHTSNSKPQVAGTVDGFWSLEGLGDKGQRTAYRRVTGDLKQLQGRTVDYKGKGKALDEDEACEGAFFTENESKELTRMIDLSTVRGTMLCEEMGLGKTVEAIALTLLHRHPLSRSRAVTGVADKEAPATPWSLSKPTVKRGRPATLNGTGEKVPIINLEAGPPGLEDPEISSWVQAESSAFAGKTAWSAESELDVAEVPTTLIVTPPSLLKQWVSEIGRHSPSVRVCVYDGWRSLSKVFTKQHAQLVKSREAKADAKKRKEAEDFRQRTSRKYAKASSGKRVKVEDEGDAHEEIEEPEGEDEDEDEESTLQRTQKAFIDYVLAHDIVITTYGDLGQDLKVAMPPPARSRRANANYQMGERARSPLVMVKWWRVVMDEVQLCGDSSNAAEMVARIPRHLSLAVSGTPAKNDIKDLMGSLRFLRVPTLPFDNRLWHRLQQPAMRPALDGIFSQIAIRTTKQQVQGEFAIPLQTRFIVPIELSEIELHYYNDTLDRYRQLLRLPTDGQARHPDWELDARLFRSCLVNLRQICTHIQVGQMRGPGHDREYRLNLGRELMTMGEALEKMKNDHSQEMILLQRAQLRAMVRKAQLVLVDPADDSRYLVATDLFGRVRESAVQTLKSLRDELARLIAKRGGDVDDASDTPERQLSQQDREQRSLIVHCQNAIRETLLLLHQSWFFQGDVHHVQKQEDLEVDAYKHAEEVRKEILSRALVVANRSVADMQRSLARAQAITRLEELQTTRTAFRSSLLTSDAATQASALLQIMNENAMLLFDWRQKIVSLLSSSIESEDANLPNVGAGQDVENPEAEFYAEALKAQGEVEAYLIAYAAVIADRKEFMLEDRSLLATHDARQVKKRVTQAAKNALEDTVIPPELPDDVHEQADLLMRERQAFRDARSTKDCSRPLKGLLIDLNGVVHGEFRDEERIIAADLASFLKKYIAEQSELVEKLNRELELFRSTFNRRVIYFAALQEVSDSVAQPEFKNLRNDITEVSRQIAELELKLSRAVVKGRFLQYLGTKSNTDSEELRDDCIICMGSSDDKQAVLLECGHFFCLSCFREFRRSTQGRKCPACRADIEQGSITKIKLNAPAQAVDSSQEVDKVQEIETSQSLEAVDPGPEANGAPPEEVERQQREEDLAKLRMLDVQKRREIAMLDMMGQYGSKIDFLIKHLLWYKSREPDARHVIFSNWSDSMNIVIQALRVNGITFTSFEMSNKKNKEVVDQFIQDTRISVFLLHAERESSGLTLTACRVVHLLEPVLRHSFELQAIGRVDRLGQDKETTVYCYATLPDTVESRILSQGVRNHTSIYLKDAAQAAQEEGRMENVVSAAHKGGDLGVGGDDEELLRLVL